MPSSGKKFKKKKCGTRGGKHVQQSQGFGHVHFANLASLQPPGAHSIGDYCTKGLIERIAHETPITSSFGNGPWTSFNNAMEQANALGLHKGPQTIQTLEQHILGNPSCPAAGVRERTPFLSSSKCQIVKISTTDGEEGDDESDNLSTQTAPPSSGRSVISHCSHSRETAVSLGSDACIASHPPTNNCDDCSAEEYEARMICDGASGWDDLFGGDDGYVPSILALQCTSHACDYTAWQWTKSDMNSCEKLLCNCPTAACMKCKGTLPRPSNEPYWLLDSGASGHFMPHKSDFINYEKLRSPVVANTAANIDIKVIAYGAVLINHIVRNKGQPETKTLRLFPVFHIPQIVARVFSLGEFLQQGMHVYGNAANISLNAPGLKNPVLQCEPCIPGDTIFWLQARSASVQLIHPVFKEDYDLMHKHFGHPSKDVLKHAKEHTLGFPKGIEIPSDNRICPECAQGKMPSKSYPISESHAKKPFEKIHLDLKSFPVVSYHKYKYFISLVDNYCHSLE